MYKYILLIIIGVTPIFTEAQEININGTIYPSKNAQLIAGKVFYNFVYLKDTTQPTELYQEKFELDFSKTASLFSSYTAKQNDSAIAAQVQQQVAEAPDPNHIALTLQGLSASNDAFYTDISGVMPTVYSLQSISSALFYIKDTQQNIHWQIEDSTKNIQGYTCQKAVGKSHGRAYTAWFCSDIPYSFGPRKLNGLPGLILEVYDANRYVVYTLDHIVIPAQGFTGIPNTAIPATQQEFDRAKEAYQKNRQTFSEAYRPSEGAVFNPLNNIDASKIASINIIKDNGTTNAGKPLKENNPIDLE